MGVLARRRSLKLQKARAGKLSCDLCRWREGSKTEEKKELVAGARTASMPTAILSSGAMSIQHFMDHLAAMLVCNQL
jgi:hypothetical protein